MSERQQRGTLPCRDNFAFIAPRSSGTVGCSFIWSDSWRLSFLLNGCSRIPDGRQSISLTRNESLWGADTLPNPRTASASLRAVYIHKAPGSAGRYFSWTAIVRTNTAEYELPALGHFTCCVGCLFLSRIRNASCRGGGCSRAHFKKLTFEAVITAPAARELDGRPTLGSHASARRGHDASP
jgi:hypothetical protein